MLHYLHHIWYDPLSASEQFQANLFIGVPVIILIVIGKVVFDWWFENYYEQ